MRRRHAGFTLLEVLVALAILAIAMSAVIKSGSENAANAIHLRDRTLAHWVAVNRLTELQLERNWPATGRNSGVVEMAGREWRWRTEIQATPVADVRRVDVRVATLDNEDAVLTVLTAFLPRPQGEGR